MTGGLWIEKGWRLSLAVSGLVLATLSSAGAADLGGNCCADLEERIAELEATTARKGNRKVSLTITGQVNQGVLFWDDGGESNAYVVTNDNSRSRFAFKGKAKIDDDWEAGYALEIGVRSANSKRFTQNNPTGDDNPADVGFDLRDSYWYLKSKTLGTVSVGNQATATDAITEINQTQTANFAKYSDVEDSGLGLLLRSAISGKLTTSGVNANGQTGLTWRRLIGDGGDQPGEGERRFNAVKYETPALAGFSVATAWGEDDFFDVALRYTGDFAGLKVAAGLGYGAITDAVQTKTVCADVEPADNPQGADAKCQQFGGSISLLHEPTGLFVNAGAGIKHDELIENSIRFGGTGVDANQDFWSVQAGIEKKFFALGKTTVYGEYYDYEGGGNQRRTLVAGDALNPFVGSKAAIWSTGVQEYGAGIAQGIDAAAMVLYLYYRHYEADLTVSRLVGSGATNDLAGVPLEPLDVVFSGAIIKF